MLELPVLLTIGCLALLLGAALGALLGRRGWGLAALKGLTASFIGGLLALELLPSAYEKLGWVSILLAAVGFLIMTLPERFLPHDHSNKGGRFFTAEMLWIGLVAHKIADGAALGMASSAVLGDWNLALVVIAHHVPVAAVVFWLFAKQKNFAQAWLRIGAMALATVVGAYMSTWAAGLMESGTLDIIYALLAGAFLHMLTHDFLDYHAHDSRDRISEFSAFLVGAILLGWLLFGLGGESGHHHGGEAHQHSDLGTAFALNFLNLTRETAPYLILGLAVSGLLAAYLPSSPINWMKRGGPGTQSLKGMAFGLPLPICSCGVLPMFLSLARKGAPPAALVSFLIATPELGIDSFLLSVKLLGWKFSLVRLVVAMILPITIALIAVRFLKPRPVIAEEKKSCCSKKKEAEEEKPVWWRFAFIELVDDILPFVFFGLFIAAVAQTLWPTSNLGELVGMWDVLLLGAIGIPFYVCASASVPLALVLLQQGFSIGAVVVFLFAGPATNVATILTVDKAFGEKSGLKLAATALLVSVALGFVVNLVYSPEVLDVIQLHDHSWSVWDYLAVPFLVLLALGSLYRSGPLHWISNVVGMIPGVVHHPRTAGDHH